MLTPVSMPLICPVTQPGTAPQFKNIFIACLFENSKNCPVTATSAKKTTTLMIINAIVSVGLNPGGCGFSSFSGSMYHSKFI
jgi:hypothetical protein